MHNHPSCLERCDKPQNYGYNADKIFDVDPYFGIKVPPQTTFVALNIF